MLMVVLIQAEVLRVVQKAAQKVVLKEAQKAVLKEVQEVVGITPGAVREGALDQSLQEAQLQARMLALKGVLEHFPSLMMTLRETTKGLKATLKLSLYQL